ncbi:flagellar hook-length control protein FliK [Selenomonas timonae]|uniref:Flagellar hook-length control protein FliK n=1 Tax=Selenomonas timonae TaxID=2754044 RepID=A0A7G7VJD7_9FIRM|nr:flagellar hook-length control protein FliK [Selenomonas timonae]QNH54230.1 flagellar hook-length control protein FliK [Selenomonas timonae]
MNASNLMAVTPADGISAGAGAPKGRSGSAGNRAQATSGKNSFSDTFGALQKGMDAEAAKSETRVTSADAAQTKTLQTESVAPSQDTQDVTAQMPKAAGQKQVEPGTEKTASVDEAAIPTAAVAALAALVNTDVPLADSDVNEGLDAALTEILERYGLTADQLGDTKLKNAVQNLLQVLPENAAKSRNLLRALEGQPLVQENAAAELGAAVQGTEAGKNPNAERVLRLAALETVLPAQLRAVLNTEPALTVENAPVLTAETVPTAEALPAEANASRNAANIATLVEGQSENLQAATETVVAPMLRAQSEQTQPAVRTATALVGENLTTDDGTANPLTVLAQRTMRHDTSQGDASEQGTQQQSAQGEQQPARMTTTMPFEVQTRTTETAPQPAQPIAVQPNAGTTPIQEVVSPAPVQEAQRPQPDYEIPRQIVEQARLMRTLTDTQMVIRLRPEHLGELTLRVAVGADGAVQASFHSDNAHVRNVIENSLVQLRQELNNQGLKVDRVGVYTGLADGQMPQGQGQEAWQQSSSHRGETQIYTRGDADDYLDEVEGVAPITAEENNGNTATDGVDYRV